MSKFTSVSPLFLAAVIAACTPTTSETVAETVPAADPLVTDAAAVPADTEGEMDVMFELGFSEYARLRLAELGETVTVSAVYYGEPVQAVADAMTEADGPVYVIGTYEATVNPEDQTITVSGGGIDDLKRANLVAAPKLNVNVYTSRTKHPDNLIDCTLIDDDVSELRAKPPATLCEMLDAN